MESLLFQAVKEGNEGEVARLLDDDPALLEKADEGLTAYLLAAMHGQLGVMQLLIQRGADVNATASGSGDTALHMAAWAGQEQAAAFLLGQGAQSTHKEADGATPLMLACGRGHLAVGHLAVVRVLAQHLGKQELEATDKKGQTALHFAAWCGNEEIVSFLLGQGAQPNSRDYKGATPFIIACVAGQTGVMRVFLQHAGPQALQATDKEGRTALHIAASCGKEEVVSFLLGQGAQANSRDEDGSTPFMLACGEGWVGVAGVLLQHVGPRALQETDEEGRTALHYAADRGHEDIVTFLLGQGAQANSRDEDGTTPFMMACVEGHMGVMKVFLQHVGAQALQETGAKGRTALHYAAFYGIGETVTFLLGQGAQANSRDEVGCTPFILACQTGRTGVVQMLLQHIGPEALRERDNGGMTALHTAAIWGHEETAAFLISQGAECSSRTAGVGVTPLMMACGEGRLGVVRLLLQHIGPEGLRERDVNGKVALHWACVEGHGEVVRVLLLSGADPTVTDSEGSTPRDIAEEEEEDDSEEEEEEDEREKKGSQAGCVAAFEVRKPHVVAHTSLVWSIYYVLRHLDVLIQGVL
jgi:ankyrin repeat protein